ncbi:MAG TPA: PLDc N-terminal domain-containing protein [Micrococcaceae bacterium]|nr:PLDc N-terminal domain-containing protein [Micrococcaceae bacterium]
MARKKMSWREMSSGQRFATLMLVAAQLTLQAAALRDLKRRPASQVNGPKAAWTAFSFVNFAGPITYFMVGRKK